MSFDHSMQLTLQCLPTVGQDAVIDALEPLLAYFGYEPADLNIIEAYSIAGATSPEGLNELCLVVDPSGVEPIDIHISTQGDVGDSFVDELIRTAENLSQLCAPGLIELRDHDTPELESAVREIWVGEGDELLIAQREHVINKCQALLVEVSLSAEQLERVAALVKSFPLPTEKVETSRPKF